jgi:hypothetical protein
VAEMIPRFVSPLSFVTPELRPSRFDQAIHLRDSDLTLEMRARLLGQMNTGDSLITLSFQL